MSTSEITTQNQLERRIDLVISLLDIDKAVEQRLAKRAKTTKMAGFRPGKVPMKIVIQQYGHEARYEAIDLSVRQAFMNAIRDQKLRVAGQPTLEPKEATDPAQMIFTAIFEVYPDVVLSDVSDCEVEKQTFQITDAEVDKVIDTLRQQNTTYSPVDRPAQLKDRVVIDFTGRQNGEVFEGGQGNDYGVLIGGGRMLPAFESALEGMTAKETKTFDLTFPTDYPATHLAGETVQFEITCQSVEAPHLPELDAEFAKTLGISDGDLIKMRQDVRNNLEREVKKRLAARFKNKVMDVLIERHPLDVPRALVEAESSQMAENSMSRLREQGMKTGSLDPVLFADQAIRRIRLGLIMAELVQKHDLHVQADQVRAIIDDYAQSFEDTEEVVNWYYSQPNRLSEAEALALENNVIDWVQTNARVIETLADFDELMGHAT
ncbi:MAG: trigger factor [Rhodocyclaceae bacterium]|nr:trigger factor [Rhodocyclaceae bacterium]